MSNYPLGAENDSNAPYNRKELQGETIGLFEYLENLEMPYNVRCELKKFDDTRTECRSSLAQICDNYYMYTELELKKELYNVIRKLSEPQIFIEE
jgi:hypothetical protein